MADLYAEGVTYRYLRRRAYALWQSGGQVSKSSGTDIFSYQELKDFQMETLKRVPKYLPDLTVDLPKSQKEWSAFNTRAEKLTAVLAEVAETNFKQPGVPSNVNAAVNIRRIQEAEGLDEEEMEEESEAIDLSNITEVPDSLPTLSLPEDTQFGSARERGEFLANLSTPGLLEYCNYRCDLEYEYLAEQMEILRDRCTKIEKIKEEIKAKAEARARRMQIVADLESKCRGEWSEVLGQILPGGSNRQKLSPAPSKLGTSVAEGSKIVGRLSGSLLGKGGAAGPSVTSGKEEGKLAKDKNKDVKEESSDDSNDASDNEQVGDTGAKEDRLKDSDATSGH
ncbi:hypothetical protein BDZ91DRAFT_394259 [Kalaharituber pfeilii]|nr:hypothetical protein BDZ91DRAFT_394259 [Kalaharituber pfeilii]